MQPLRALLLLIFVSSFLNTVQSTILQRLPTKGETTDIFSDISDLEKLQVIKDSDGNIHTMFVNPASYLITPIWFKCDIEGNWWWTPYSDNLRWISVQSDVVKGVTIGVFHYQKPALENLKIIHTFRERGVELALRIASITDGTSQENDDQGDDEQKKKARFQLPRVLFKPVTPVDNNRVVAHEL